MRRQGDPSFFEGFRRALACAPAGLLRASPPAPAAAIAAAEAQLGRPLPPSYRDFLRSFDGADLFHEGLLVCGVGPGCAKELVSANRITAGAPLFLPGDLLVAEADGGDQFVISPAALAGYTEAVVRLRAGSDERWLSGSDFAHWLDAVVARELLLYDREGEFVFEAFEPGGEELTPAFALKQAERALKRDPDSAESHHDAGVAHRRLGRMQRAAEAFARAAALDATNPWPAFDLGRALLARGIPAEAAQAFRRAAAAQAGAAGARSLAWATRALIAAGRLQEAAESRRQAQARHPDLLADLRRSADAARAESDHEAAAEAAALAEALQERPPVRLPLADRRPR